MSDNEDTTTKAASLNVLNYANAVSYVINVLITFGVGTLGWFGAQTNTELSAKYITLVTPKGTAFSIWAVIFLFQLIFTVVQFLPQFRASALVQDGVSYWYIGTCITQAAWTLAFSFEQITLSLVFIILIWLSLVAIVFFQYYIAKKQQPDNTLLEFWLLRFPFALHCGWLTCATGLNFNVLAVSYYPDDATLQLAMGIVTLAVLYAVAVWVIFALDRPNFTIALVIAWATDFISNQLSDPFDLIKERFTTIIINSVLRASLAVAIGIAIMVAVRLILLTGVTKFCFNPEGEEETEALVRESKTEAAAVESNENSEESENV